MGLTIDHPYHHKCVAFGDKFSLTVTYFRNMSFTDNSIVTLKMALNDKKSAIERVLPFSRRIKNPGLRK